jgi:tRNA(adenine34) deaminase
MRIALAEAEAAAADDEVPVGAIVARGGTVLARARNSPRRLCDPTAHAEILALREAARVEGSYRLTGADLIVTLEPCLMCVGAAVHARIGRIVFGAADPKAGATWILRHDWPGDARLNHAIAIVASIEEAACGDLLRRFFAKRR